MLSVLTCHGILFVVFFSLVVVFWGFGCGGFFVCVCLFALVLFVCLFFNEQSVGISLVASQLSGGRSRI